MKSRKNKLTNLLKTGILLFGISLFLWNCNNENEVIENNQSNLLEKLQNNFNAENFKEALPYDFEVNWNNSLKQYSEELETSYYEFPIIYMSKFNPDEILKSKPQKNKYNISYKILITENEKQEYIYYVVKFYKENSKNTSHLEKSFAGSSNFSGFIHLLNKSGDIVFAKKLEGGIEDSKKFYNKEFKKKRNKDENLYARVDETCITLTTHSYTDNYVRWGNGPAIYVSTTYNGSTSTTSCESYWLPGLNIGGGGGAGTYRNNGNGGVYKDSNTPTRYQIRDLSLECEQGYVYDAVLEPCLPVQIFNYLTGKAHCIYGKMEDNNNNINWILENFNDGSTPSAFNLKFVMSTDLPSGTNGRFSENGYDFTVEINGNTLSNRTSLEVAGTILHEGIHARLREFARRGNSNATTFPGIYDYYRIYEKNWDHQQMTDYYRSTIAKGLKQFDNGQHTDQFYSDLAWRGLIAIKDLNGNTGNVSIYTEAWKKLTTLEQNRIKDNMKNEKDNGTKTCQ